MNDTTSAGGPVSLHLTRCRPGIVTVEYLGSADYSGGGLAVGVAGAMLLTLLSFASPAGASTGTLADFEQRVIELHNEARVAEGLPPLEPHRLLIEHSRDWSAEMAKQQKMMHQTPSNGYTSYLQTTCAAADPGGWAWCAENVARGYSSPESAWIHRPGSCLSVRVSAEKRRFGFPRGQRGSMVGSRSQLGRPA